MSQHNKYLIYIIAGLLTVILVLGIYIVFSKSSGTLPGDREKALRDSLKQAVIIIEESHKRQDIIERAYDSIKNQEPQILYKNNGKTKFIFNTASPNQLDSIIRSTWGKRYY